jgi:uncharacterized protein YhaN
MKKLFAVLVLVGGMWSANLASGVEMNTSRNANTATAQAERIAEISARVEKIKEIDKRSVGKSEWQEIRKELKNYKKELKDMKAQAPYIYISLTALLLIIIIILLIA